MGGASRLIQLALVITAVAGVTLGTLAHMSVARAADAQTSAELTNAQQLRTQSSVTYRYAQLSAEQTYGYFVAELFTTAGGLLLYIVSYVPAKQSTTWRTRSRYISRYYDYAKTTY